MRYVFPDSIKHRYRLLQDLKTVSFQPLRISAKFYSICLQIHFTINVAQTFAILSSRAAMKATAGLGTFFIFIYTVLHRLFLRTQISTLITLSRKKKSTQISTANEFFTGRNKRVHYKFFLLRQTQFYAILQAIKSCCTILSCFQNFFSYPYLRRLSNSINIVLILASLFIDEEHHVCNE